MNNRKELFDYGYKYLGMQEIPYEIAMRIAEEKAVYLLYEDNTEALSEDYDDIKRHNEKGGKFGIEIDNYSDYVVFILGRDLLNDILLSNLENDLAYEICIGVARDFKVSEFDVSTKSLYSCLQEYVENVFDNKNGEITMYGEKIYNIKF